MRPVAAVDNAFGKGRTLLIGTMIGAGHAAHGGAGFRPAISAPFFADLLRFGGQAQHVRCSDRA